jgi:VWFA-related protein
MFDPRCVALALFALLFQSASTPSDLRVGPIYAEKFPTLEIVVEAPSVIAAQDLTLVEDGQATVAATSINPFKETGRGMAIVLALDVSGTMRGEPLADMKRALSAFVAQAGPQDRVAIISFADSINVEAPFGSSPDQLKAAINKLATRGQITELYKGLRQSLALFDSANLPERKRLIVISDGLDEGVAYKLEDVIEEAARRRIPVDAIGLTRVDPKHLSNLNRLADKTGGRYERAEDSARLEGIFRQGVEWLQATPVAVFTARNLQADGQEHRVGVRVNTGGRMMTAETTLITTKRETPAPTISPSPASASSSNTFEKIPIWVWPVAAGLALGLIALVVTAMRRRSKTKPAKPIAPPVQPSSFDQRAGNQRAGNQPVSDPLLNQPASPGKPTEAEVEEEATENLWLNPRMVETEAARDQVQETVKPARRKTQVRVEFRAPEIGRPSAILIAEEGALAGGSAPIETSPFWIGSEEESDLFIEGDTYLSGYHACIEYRDGTLLLYDNNSTNGTFLNGERLAGAPRPLGIGDRIKVGHSIFVIAGA